MPTLLWDASALAKRYIFEVGSETVDALFAAVSAQDMVVTHLGYVETYSILVRRHNAGHFNASAFKDAATSLDADVLEPDGFDLVSIPDRIILEGTFFVRTHHVNSADAVIRSAYLDVQATLSPNPCLLIASDKRLLRAASAEGLPCLNPKTTAIEDLPALLAPL